MNFTREPIIETIITPKDGNKLIVRSSKSREQEEYSVEAVEVVSFGQALFFRSVERPNCFLVPVGDYEVIEAKESRVVLKNAQFERTIKIGGGRDASIRKEAKEKQEYEEEQEFVAETQEESSEEGSEFDRKRGRRNRRRRGDERRERPLQENSAPRGEFIPPEEVQERAKEENTQNSATIFSSLIPPPTTLISDSIKRYKEMLGLDTTAPVEPIFEKDEEFNDEEDVKPEEEDKGEPTSFSRTAIQSVETSVFQETTTNFSKATDWFNFLP